MYNEANGTTTRVQIRCPAIKNGFGSIREKMDQQTITALQTQLCDAKSKISALESQAFITQSNLAQSANIIGHVRAMIPATTATTGTAA